MLIALKKKAFDTMNVPLVKKGTKKSGLENTIVYYSYISSVCGIPPERAMRHTVLHCIVVRGLFAHDEEITV